MIGKSAFLFISRNHCASTLMALLALLPAQPAFSGGRFNPTTSTIQLPVEITVPASAPVGTRLWTSNRVTSRMYMDTNSDRSSRMLAEVLGGSPGNNPEIYETNIRGLGIRWWGNWTGRRFPANGINHPITTIANSLQQIPDTDFNQTYSQNVWIELIKTGLTLNGNLSIASNANVRHGCNAGCTPWDIRISGQTRIVTAPVCTVATPTQSIPLGNVPISRFMGTGSVSVAQPFSITLTCMGGTAGSFTRPHVTLTDASNTSNRSTTLSLSSGADNAMGIGIQILHNGTVLAYGPASDAAGTVNEWDAGTVREGEASFTIPLTARYVQTQAAVSIGVANGRAIFTMNYQ